MTNEMNVNIFNKRPENGNQNGVSNIFATKNNEEILLFSSNNEIKNIENEPIFNFNSTDKKSLDKEDNRQNLMNNEYDFHIASNTYYDLLCRKKTSSKNTKRIMKDIQKIDTDNLELTFKVFQSQKQNLPEVIMRNLNLSEEQKKECLNHLVQVGKAALDAKNINSDDIMKDLTESIEKLDLKTSDIKDRKRIAADFDKLLNRLNSPNLPTEQNQNGTVDKDFKQGKTQDCWLLASINGLNKTEQGKKILDDAVSVNNDGNITVKFDGVGKSYTISKEELEASDELSTGDNDVRAIEIAAGKYYREAVPDGKADINFNSIRNGFNLFTSKYQTTSYSNKNVKKGLEDIEKIGFKNVAVGTAISQNSKFMPVGAKTTDGKSVKLSKEHAYTMTGMDENFVYLDNTDTTQHIKVPKEEYLKSFDYISVADFSPEKMKALNILNNLNKKN